MNVHIIDTTYMTGPEFHHFVMYLLIFELLIKKILLTTYMTGPEFHHFVMYLLIFELLIKKILLFFSSFFKKKKKKWIKLSIMYHQGNI